MSLKPVAMSVILLLAIILVPIDGVDADKQNTYDYSDVNSHYYNGIYVRITESIEETGVGVKVNGETFNYDLLKTEYITYPDSDESYVTAKYFNDGSLVYSDSRDYRNDDGTVEAYTDDGWKQVVPVSDSGITTYEVGYLVAAGFGASLFGLVGVVVIVTVAVGIHLLIESGKQTTPDATEDEIRYETITNEEIVIQYRNDVVATVTIAGITAPAYDFCDETLKDLDAFVYYFVCKTPIPDEKGNDTFIFPVSFNLSIATEIMQIDSDCYHVWTAYGDWAESPCERMYGLNTWIFHLAAQDFETFNHYHGVGSDGSISESMSFYGFAWGELYESDDPENQQKPRR